MAGGMEIRMDAEAAAAAGRIPGATVMAADIHIVLAEVPRSLGMAAHRSLAGVAVGRNLPAPAEVADSRTGPVGARRRAAREVAAGSSRRLAGRVLSWSVCAAKYPVSANRDRVPLTPIRRIAAAVRHDRWEQ